MAIALVGTKSRPNYITGQSVAFDQIVKTIDLKRSCVIDINFSNTRLIVKTFNYFSAYLKLARCLFTRPANKVYLTIAQSKAGFLRDLGFIWISYFFRKPIILHLHGGDYLNFYKSQPLFVQRLIKTTISRANKLIVLSDAFKNIFSFVDNYQEKTVVVHNGVKVPEVTPVKKLSGKLQLLYLSNLIESKGYLDVLHAAKHLKEKYQLDFELHFCGKFLSSEDDTTFLNPQYAEQNFHAFVENNSLADYVHFHGTVSGEEKQRFLKQAHFILLPSYYKAEGQPISIIEGLANGCVPICTAYRDLQYMVLDGYNGFIVEKKNPEEIANKIAAVTPEEFERLSTNSYSHFLQNYTLDQYLDKLNKIFNE